MFCHSKLNNYDTSININNINLWDKKKLLVLEYKTNYIEEKRSVQGDGDYLEWSEIMGCGDGWVQ